MESRQAFIAIDLKSFYASVECVERGLDPLTAHLVVADASRTEKTICLAVSPALKSRLGIGGRPRLFEVVQHAGKEVDYIVAPPRMALYLDYSARIYKVYLRYIAPEDIHVYSVDEVFIDASSYMKTYGLSPHELAMKMIRDVLAETGITATAGVGTNMYLAKVAMDIVAKKMQPDRDGVRIAELDERSYREQLWGHEPLTDFWHVGRGIARRLAKYGIYTMGDIARCSLGREKFLFKQFGVNAELLIDHAWGREPVTMAHIKSYRPETHSISSGQVLTEPYSIASARIVALEMADSLALKLTDKGFISDKFVLELGYDVESLSRPGIEYDGPVDRDHYGRLVPRHSHGTANLPLPSATSSEIMEAIGALFDRIANPALLLRRLNITACDLKDERELPTGVPAVQLTLFSDYRKEMRRIEEEADARMREKRRMTAIIQIKKRFGKNAILRGLNFAEGATQRERNAQIGGHKA